MDIAELSLRSGLPASTLRYYEEKGLIRSIGRHGLRRVFAPDVLSKLALVTMAKQSGFSLNEIAQMFDEAGVPLLDKAMFNAKADEIDATIRKLSAVRDGLRHIAKCTAENHWACPEFQRIVQDAVSMARNRPR